MGHDLEDILMVVDGRPELGDELHQAPQELQAFVRREFTALLAHDDFEETVLGTFSGDDRQQVVLGRVRAIAQA